MEFYTQEPGLKSFFYKNKALLFVLFAVVTVAGLYTLWEKGGWSSTRTYAVRPLSAETKAFAIPALPDIGGYTMEAIAARTPPRSAGVIDIVPLEKSTLVPRMALHRSKVMGILATLQQQEKPVAIEIRSGVYTLEDLATAVNNPLYLERSQGAYILKIPIFIEKGAALIVGGNPGIRTRFYLGEETGAFVSVFGSFFATYADIVGWRLAKDAPAVFQDRDAFRPFLVFWNTSESYLGKVTLRSLGYSSPKTYGLSYASDNMVTGDEYRKTKMNAWLIDSLIEDLYYGMYCYEFNDIVMLRNEFKDNIIYGIDPHDRSARLIIGYNNSHGTKKRHGIIISREVTDSWIFNNHSHRNHGSGIMIDRLSVRNIVANNVSEYNGNDGLVFFESPDNISYNNNLRLNGKSGVRIRNSWNLRLVGDRILDNRGYGVLAYTAALEDNENAKETRDVKLDPYGMRAAFDILGAEMNGNLAGNFNLMDLERAAFYNLNVFRAPGGYFEGDKRIKDLLYALYDPSLRGGDGIELYQTNYTPRYSKFWKHQVKEAP